MRSKRVVVVGSANVDLVVDISHQPAPGETIIGSDLTTTPGGKGANQAVAASELGADVKFVGCVGDDASGRLLRESLQTAGADVSMLRTATAPTGNAIIMVTPDGNNSIIVAPGANRCLTTDILEESRALWQSAAVVVAQLEIPLETVNHLALQAGLAGVRLVLNAAPAAILERATLSVCVSSGRPSVCAIPWSSTKPKQHSWSAARQPMPSHPMSSGPCLPWVLTRSWSPWAVSARSLLEPTHRTKSCTSPGLLTWLPL